LLKQDSSTVLALDLRSSFAIIHEAWLFGWASFWTFGTPKPDIDCNTKQVFRTHKSFAKVTAIILAKQMYETPVDYTR